MTSFSFREAMMTHLLLWGNAYAQIVRDGKNGILDCTRFSRKTWRSTGQRMESFSIPTMLTRMSSR